jgi:hypothetical protein
MLQYIRGFTNYNQDLHTMTYLKNTALQSVGYSILNSEMLSKLEVYATVSVDEQSDLRKVVDNFINSYVENSKEQKFSYRILLPRNIGASNSVAKKLGLILQGEIIISMKKRKLIPDVREIRYLHDQEHFGWLFLDPQLMDNLNIR